MHARSLTAWTLALSLALPLTLPSHASAEEPPERVVMKLEEFLRLYETTRKKDEEPPRESALASSRYKGEVVFEDGKPHAAVFKAKQHIEIFKAKGWARVPLLPATVALQSAKIGGKEAHDLSLHGPRQVFTLAKLQTGYTRYVRPIGGLQAGVGAMISAAIVPDALSTVFGSRVNRGFGVYLTLRPARHL